MWYGGEEFSMNFAVIIVFKLNTLYWLIPRCLHSIIIIIIIIIIIVFIFIITIIIDIL